MTIPSDITAVDQRVVRRVFVALLLLLIAAGVALTLRYRSIRNFAAGAVSIPIGPGDNATLTEPNALRWCEQAIRTVVPACTGVKPVADDRATPDRYMLKNSDRPAEGTIVFIVSTTQWGDRTAYTHTTVHPDHVECEVSIPR